MRRIATLGIAGCTLMVMTFWAMEVAVTCINDLYPELGERAALIDRRWQELESFEPRFEAIANEVALGRQSLRDASKAIEDAALEHHPAYLQHIETLDTGATLHAKLASVLLNHLKTIRPNEGRGLDVARQAKLARELEEMLADE